MKNVSLLELKEYKKNLDLKYKSSLESLQRNALSFEMDNEKFNFYDYIDIIEKIDYEILVAECSNEISFYLNNSQTEYMMSLHQAIKKKECLERLLSDLESVKCNFIDQNQRIDILVNAGFKPKFNETLNQLIQSIDSIKVDIYNLNVIIPKYLKDINVEIDEELFKLFLI